MPVYLIQAASTPEGPVKIGWADEAPLERLRALQTGFWEELKIIRLMDGPRALEGWLHQFFSEQRIRGEWFRFTEAMLYITQDDVIPPPARQRPAKHYDPPLQQVLKKIGPTELARRLGVVPSAVTQWRRVPARHVLRIAALTGIPAAELRPDMAPATDAA